MELKDLLLKFRKDVADQARPYLWDDDEVLQFAIDAQDMYVRLTGGIADSSTVAITEIPVITGDVLAAHSPYILRIRSAKLLTARKNLFIGREADVQQLTYSDYGIQRSCYLDDEDTGEVEAIILGVEKNKIRWFKVPVEDDTCKLNVRRLPYPRILTEDDCLEIDEQHHIHLLKWMKHLAYSKEDAETYDKELAELNEDAFRRYCNQAATEEENQRYKVRVVQYGGI